MLLMQLVNSRRFPLTSTDDGDNLPDVFTNPVWVLQGIFQAPHNLLTINI